MALSVIRVPIRADSSHVIQSARIIAKHLNELADELQALAEQDLDHCPGCAHRYGTGCGCPCCAAIEVTP